MRLRRSSARPLSCYAAAQHPRATGLGEVPEREVPARSCLSPTAFGHDCPMNIEDGAVHQMAGGDIDVWVDPGGAICLQKRISDPVELAEHEAVALAELLLRLAGRARVDARHG
jgi:hypothetical protein